MAAFDKVKSGIPSADQLLDHIRMGDNVVWSVSNLDEFRFFALPFVEQAIEDGRNLIYMRFANHEPILTPREGLKIYEFDPDKGFEAFTVDIYNRITAEGKDAFYVFDSLSSLQSVWYTDLMMGNFFRVTCPYLFRLDTVAYFPVIRGLFSGHPWTPFLSCDCTDPGYDAAIFRCIQQQPHLSASFKSLEPLFYENVHGSCLHKRRKRFSSGHGRRRVKPLLSAFRRGISYNAGSKL